MSITKRIGPRGLAHSTILCPTITFLDTPPGFTEPVATKQHRQLNIWFFNHNLYARHTEMGHEPYMLNSLHIRINKQI